MKKKQIFCIIIGMFFCVSCAKSPSLLYPVSEITAKHLVDETLEQWEVAEYQKRDETHQVIHLRNQEEISCVMDLYGGADASWRAGLALISYPVSMEAEDMEKCRIMLWPELEKISKAFYGMKRGEAKLWRNFLRDVDKEITCEGNQWVWEECKEGTFLKVVLKRRGNSEPWQMQQAILMTEQWRKDENEKKASEYSEKPGYIRYNSISELEADRKSRTEGSEEHCGEVTGRISRISYSDKMPENLDKQQFGYFPAGKNGYVKGFCRTQAVK